MSKSVGGFKEKELVIPSPGPVNLTALPEREARTAPRAVFIAAIISAGVVAAGVAPLQSIVV